MKKYLRLLALLAILGLFVMGQSGCTGCGTSSGTGGGGGNNTPTTATIMGQVVDTYSNQPVEGATVSIQGTGLSTQTDSQGQYQITNVPAGTVTMVVSKTGYHTLTQNVVLVAGSTNTTDFHLTPIVTVPLINETFTVSAGSYKEYHGSLSEGGVLSIVLSATQDVQFYIFDDTNYQKWLNGQSNTAYLGITNTSSFSQLFVVPSTQTYHIVIQNTHTLLSSDVTLTVNYTY